VTIVSPVPWYQSPSPPYAKDEIVSCHLGGWSDWGAHCAGRRSLYAFANARNGAPFTPLFALLRSNPPIRMESSSAIGGGAMHMAAWPVPQAHRNMGQGICGVYGCSWLVA
jgi:hypothetical protein